MRLLHKIKHYGINEQITNWIRSFLSNIQQCVQVNGSRSSWRNVTSGIPQGSVLGPILFVLFVNDLPNNVISDVFMSADNTKLFREIVDQNDQNFIEEDLDILFDWSKTWLLQFHPDKCKVLPISGRNTTHEPPNYKMKKYEGGCTNLENVKSEKDIGVTIDTNLTFANHIQNQVNKANQIVGLTRRSFVHLDNRTFTLVFKVLVRLNLEYANSI